MFLQLIQLFEYLKQRILQTATGVMLHLASEEGMAVLLWTLLGTLRLFYAAIALAVEAELGRANGAGGRAGIILWLSLHAMWSCYTMLSHRATQKPACRDAGVALYR